MVSDETVVVGSVDVVAETVVDVVAVMTVVVDGTDVVGSAMAEIDGRV